MKSLSIFPKHVDLELGNYSVKCQNQSVQPVFVECGYAHQVILTQKVHENTMSPSQGTTEMASQKGRKHCWVGNGMVWEGWSDLLEPAHTTLQEPIVKSKKFYELLLKYSHYLQNYINLQLNTLYNEQRQ